MDFVVVPVFPIAPVELIRYFGSFTRIVFEAIYITSLPLHHALVFAAADFAALLVEELASVLAAAPTFPP